jgi:anti-sigma B factor antagonist
MKIDRYEVRDVTVLALTGKITLGEGDETLRDAVNGLLAEGRQKFVLDLKDVPYIDSARSAEIVRAYTSVRRQGGRLVLCHPGAQLIKVWSIQKLLTIWEIYESFEDAIRSFSASIGSEAVHLRVSCPVCNSGQALRVRSETNHVCQTCHRCNSTFDLSGDFPAAHASTARVVSVSMPVYTNDCARLSCCPHPVIELTRRFDLFAVEAVEKLWRLLPLPRRCVIELPDIIELSDAGIVWLIRLCSDTAPGHRAVLLSRNRHLPRTLENVPVHTEIETAIAALGQMDERTSMVVVPVNPSA